MTRSTYSFDQPPPGTEKELLGLLGGKGRNLALMRSGLSLPVPPGFTITTVAGNEFMERGWQSSLSEEIRTQISRIESEVGRRFGGSGEPLLVSVRSGAAVSMPGMMDTILNLGLSPSNVDALAAACGDSDFAAESMQRFRSMYQSIVGLTPPDDPWEQLRGAIEAVFRSWNSSRAKAYRQREGIPDDLGTAVTVQAMVFGNLDDDSGTGVLFTRNPATGEPGVYGDVLFRAQGEDVVDGSHQTNSIETLSIRLPDVANELSHHARTLEHHFRDVCDIEFTIERGTLWLLQVRVGKRTPQAALRFAVDMAEDDGFPLSKEEAVQRVLPQLAQPPVLTEIFTGTEEKLGTGLPASPGLVSGKVCTNTNDAVGMAESGEDVILVRPETSPEDIHGMAKASGILTSTGGLASHAAVVARGWGLPAVVGARQVEVDADGIRIGEVTIPKGETITIDGDTGDFYRGEIEVRTSVPAEVGILSRWAEELGIEVGGEGRTDSPTATSEESDGGLLQVDDLVRLLNIKGFVTPEPVAEIFSVAIDLATAELAALEQRGWLKKMGPMFQLDGEARERGDRLMESDRVQLGEEAANQALDTFIPLDRRMKTIVTAWQVREIEGEQVINDHTDTSYDKGVLSDLSGLHDDAMTWLTPVCEGLPRLEMYARRLTRAAEQVAAGNHDYVASPRLDSYHNVWFELHEDLIRLAGRTREEETEAGRA